MSNDPTNTTTPPAPVADAAPVAPVLPETADFGVAPALTVPTIPPLVSKAIEAAVAQRGKVLTVKLDTALAAKAFENLLKRASTWSETKIRSKIQPDDLTVHFTHPEPKMTEKPIPAESAAK